MGGALTAELRFAALDDHRGPDLRDRSAFPVGALAGPCFPLRLATSTGFSIAISEPRCLRALGRGHPKWGRGSQFHAVPPVILGSIQSLVGCLDHLLGLAVAGARLGNADADRHR